MKILFFGFISFWIVFSEANGTSCKLLLDKEVNLYKEDLIEDTGYSDSIWHAFRKYPLFIEKILVKKEFLTEEQAFEWKRVDSLFKKKVDDMLKAKKKSGKPWRGYDEYKRILSSAFPSFESGEMLARTKYHSKGRLTEVSYDVFFENHPIKNILLVHELTHLLHDGLYFEDALQSYVRFLGRYRSEIYAYKAQYRFARSLYNDFNMNELEKIYPTALEEKEFFLLMEEGILKEEGEQGALFLYLPELEEIKSQEVLNVIVKMLRLVTNRDFLSGLEEVLFYSEHEFIQLHVDISLYREDQERWIKIRNRLKKLYSGKEPSKLEPDRILAIYKDVLSLE